MSLTDYQIDRNANMDRETVLRVAEEHDLQITIRPDGKVIGFEDELARLRYYYDGEIYL